jgi:hypothetical protein
MDLKVILRMGGCGPGSCEHGNEPSGSMNTGIFLTSSVTISFLRRTQLNGLSN